MSRPTQTKCWIVSNKPHGTPTISGPDPTFTLTTQSLPSSLGPDQVLVKVLHISNDPAQRSWINPTYPQERFYIKLVAESEVMASLGVGEVLESTSSKFKPGDRISGVMGWAEYAVLGDQDLMVHVKPLPNGLGETHYLGAFGLTGLTAYFGLVKVAAIKEGEGVLVSGAAGATGSMVVQLAKRVLGCKYVVGIAGTEEKCRWVESLGADRCVNYKSPSFVQDLQEATKDRIDVYFDNVGGAVLDEALGVLNVHGRVVACGFIAGYNGDHGPPLRNWYNVVTMKLRIEGFVVLEYYNEADKAIDVIGKAVVEGKVQLEEKNETIIKGGLEDVPKVWMRLFEGANTGKLVTTLQ